MSRKKGFIHIYTGDGKGKTTAAVGLAVRAAGQGLRVLFVQFFKPGSDPSGEKNVLSGSVPNVELIRSEARHPFFTGPDTDLAKVRGAVMETFSLARERAGGVDMLVLDEVIGAVNGGFLDMKELVGFLEGRPEGLEVVLTGREAPVELIRAADYVTEMLCIKHPFNEGAKARRGIEY